jgi:hypothetical protein
MSRNTFIFWVVSIVGLVPIVERLVTSEPDTAVAVRGAPANVVVHDTVVAHGAPVSAVQPAHVAEAPRPRAAGTI